MSTLTIKGYARRDGKYPVTISYAGAPNAFGGFYPSSHVNFLWPLDKIREWASKPYVEVVGAHFLPYESKEKA